MRLNSIINGTFGAHNGPGNGFFGARGILCAPEGDGGGGGAGAAAKSEGEAVTPPPASVKFTPEQQEEVNKIAARARDDGRKAATKQTEKPPAPAPADDGEKLSLKSLQAELAETKARAAFDKRVAKLGLSDEAADDMFSLHQLQKPTDQAAWIESKSKLFVNGASVPINPQPNTTTTTEPAKQPAAAPSAPSQVNPLTSGGLVNLWGLPEAQIDAMTPATIRGHFEKILETGRAQSGAPPRPMPTQRK